MGARKASPRGGSCLSARETGERITVGRQSAAREYFCRNGRREQRLPCAKGGGFLRSKKTEGLENTSRTTNNPPVSAFAEPAPFTQGGLGGCRGVSHRGAVYRIRRQANISHCGNNISYRRQAVYHSSPEGDEYEHPSPSRFACHLSPRGEARGGWQEVVQTSRRGGSPTLRGNFTKKDRMQNASDLFFLFNLSLIPDHGFFAGSDKTARRGFRFPPDRGAYRFSPAH